MDNNLDHLHDMSLPEQTKLLVLDHYKEADEESYFGFVSVYYRGAILTWDAIADLYNPDTLRNDLDQVLGFVGLDRGMSYGDTLQYLTNKNRDEFPFYVIVRMNSEITFDLDVRILPHKVRICIENGISTKVVLEIAEGIKIERTFNPDQCTSTDFDHAILRGEPLKDYVNNVLYMAGLCDVDASTLPVRYTPKYIGRTLRTLDKTVVDYAEANGLSGLPFKLTIGECIED